MTLRNIETDNGKGYLKLLRLLMPEAFLEQCVSRLLRLSR